MIQEYGADRFDLILSKSGIDYEVPYRVDGEYLDITQGVMKLLERKIHEVDASLAAQKSGQP